MKKLTAISLFTGAGGLDYGFEAAGFRTAVAVELDATCALTNGANRRWPWIGDDINKVSSSDVLARAGLPSDEPDVLIGGPPCQPFSKSGYWAAGDSRRLLDPRASTLGAYLRVLRETRPRAFLLENVEGLGFRGKDEGLRLISSTIEDINRACGTSYQLNVAVLNAAEFGVPQLRRRLFVVGSRNGTRFEFPSSTHVDNEMCTVDDPRPRFVTTWDALHDLPLNVDEQLAVRGKWGDLLPSIPEGQNYLWHTARGGGQPLFGWRRRFWSFLLKIAKDRPAWTIQAQPGPATGPFHWSNRRLSMREMARLQTFPDDVSIIGNITTAHKQIGNAVPSLLAEVLARSIAVQLLGGRPTRKPPKLAVKLATSPPPVPEKIRAVPRKYLALRGEHEAHPGTGQGRRASARSASQLEVA